MKYFSSNQPRRGFGHPTTLLLAALLLTAAPVAFAQTGSVGIGTTAPDVSAALDIVSSTKGLLLPRVADATAIVTPAAGLLVFQTGGTPGFYYNAGTSATPSWQQLATASGAAITASNGLTKTGPDVALGGTLTGATTVGLGNNNLSFTSTGGNVGIGTPAPDPAAALDISSTTRGLLPPRLTTAQRDALTTAQNLGATQAGLLIFNTTTSALNQWNGSNWVTPLVGNASSPLAAFAYTGSPQTYVVPAGVTLLRVTASGAAGGNYTSQTNYGPGARVSANVLVTPGETLTIVVGGQGERNAVINPGGYNGGGGGGGRAGGGGGATELRRAPAAGVTGDYLSSRNALVVAGGGGGSDLDALGGAGGTPNGDSGQNVPGSGATQTAPGGGGPSAGAANQGGTSPFFGGGGGGYYGGGAGANIARGSAGGGGGSSWTLTAATAVFYNLETTADNGSLTLGPIQPDQIAFDGSTLTNLNISQYWKRNSAGLYPSHLYDKVGIGTTTPLQLLHLGNTLLPQSALLRMAAGNGSASRSWDLGLQVNPTTPGDATGEYYDFVIRDASANATRLLVEWNTGNVGIGTSAPDRPLTIQGRTGNNELLSFSNNAGITKWHWNMNPGTGLNLAESGVADYRLFIKAGGNVGIGTNNPTSRLYVVSTDNTVNTFVDFQAQNLTQGVGIWYGGLRKTGSNPIGDLAIDSKSTGNLVLNANGGTGNVGIANPLPQQLLHLGTRTYAKPAFVRLSAGNGNAQRDWELGIPVDAANAGDPYGEHYDFTLRDATADATRLLVEWNTGNVGIGTSAPGTRLEVNGGLTLTETASTALTGASPGYTIPPNVSLVRLVPSGTAPTGTIALTSTTPVSGQHLAVYNGTTIPATLDSQPIAAGQAVSFVYSNGGWRPVGDGGAATLTASNGLTKTGSDVALGGTLSGATTVGLGNNNLSFTSTGGNVGIGTTAPDRPLTIQGSALTNELLSFSDNTGTTKWHWNMGTGLNLAESGVADYRLFIKAGGNVGIGTSNPTAKLQVVGDVLVPAANAYLYATAKAYALHMGSTDFQPLTAASTKLANSFYHSFYSGGANGVFEAPVHLPQGATITSLDLILIDTDSNNDIVIALQAMPYNGTATTMVTYTSVTVATSSQYQNINVPVSGGVINNTTNNYYFQATISGSNSGVALKTVRVNYTVTQTE